MCTFCSGIPSVTTSVIVIAAELGVKEIKSFVFDSASKWHDISPTIKVCETRTTIGRSSSTFETVQLFVRIRNWKNISSLKIFYLRPTRPMIPTLKSALVTLMVTLTIWARIGEQESGKNCKLRLRSGTKKKRNSNPALIWCLLVLDCILVCIQVCNTKLARFEAGPGHINISQARPFFSSRNHVEKN